MTISLGVGGLLIQSVVRRRRFLIACCFGLLVVAASLFLFTLDRYPVYFFDEPFFNISAARWIDGQSFAYPIHSQAPHQETAFAPHAPFFFRLQVLTFRLLGVSHFACRIPSYAGGHIAVLGLCLFLIGRQRGLAAVITAFAWIGCRAPLQLLLGRPEGVCLLGCAGGFVALAAGLADLKRTWLAVAGLAIGLAAGFHPAAGVFGVAAAIATGLLAPAGNRWQYVLALAAGVLVPALLVVVCWWPDVAGSIEQFQWFEKYVNRMLGAYSLQRLALWTKGGWAAAWLMLLQIALGILLIPASIVVLTGRQTTANRNTIVLVVCSCLFALAGAVVFARSATHPYYLVYFTIWVIMGCAVLLDWAAASGRKLLCLLSAAVGLSCWLPSLAWNATRVREAWIVRDAVVRQGFAAELAGVVPAGAETQGDPCFFIAARQADLSFTPLSFYHDDDTMAVSDQAFLLLSQRYVHSLEGGHGDPLAGRPVLYETEPFGGAAGPLFAATVLGPKGGASQVVSGRPLDQPAHQGAAGDYVLATGPSE